MFLSPYSILCNEGYKKYILPNSDFPYYKFKPDTSPENQKKILKTLDDVYEEAETEGRES